MNFKKHYLNLKKYIFNKFILNGKFILLIIIIINNIFITNFI